jgi:hypothetical protein
MPIQFITPSIISSVANTQVTGTITASQIATVNANTITSGSIPLAQVPQLTRAKMPTGSVLQVVQNSTTVGSVSTTSTSFVDLTNATATITPSAIANKILVLWMSAAGNSLVGATNVRYTHQILRAATSLASVELSAESGSGGLQTTQTISFSILDAPNTTSAVTYKIQHSVTSASSTGFVNNGFLTLLEIAG